MTVPVLNLPRCIRSSLAENFHALISLHLFKIRIFFSGSLGQPNELFSYQTTSSSHPQELGVSCEKEAPFGSRNSRNEQRTGKHQIDSWRVHRRHSARCAPQRQNIPLDYSAGRIRGYCLLGTGIHFRGRPIRSPKLPGEACCRPTEKSLTRIS